MKSMNRSGISKSVNYRNESNAKTENYQLQNKEPNGQKNKLMNVYVSTNYLTKHSKIKNSKKEVLTMCTIT